MIEYLLKYFKIRIPMSNNLKPGNSSYGTFFDALSGIETNPQNRNFEEYMLALYGLLLNTSPQSCSASLLLGLLKEAYHAPVYPFDDEWLDSAAQPEFEDLITAKNQEDGFSLLLNVMRFQIAELHRIGEKWPSEEEQMYGYTSPTGTRWENLQPIYNLKSGIRCMKDYKMDTEKITWQYLAAAFEFGRVYE